MIESFEIHYTGFHCVKSSGRDGLSRTDEPYFIFTVGDGMDIARQRRTEEYSRVVSGATRRQPGEFPIWRTTELDSERPVISIVASAFEADFGGQAEKAEKAVKDIVGAAVKAGIGGLAKGAKAGPKGAVVGFGIGLASKLAGDLAAKLTGFRDDIVGVSGVHLSREDIRRLARTPVKFFGSDPIPWHIVVRVRDDPDGRSDGTYFLFLRVVSRVTQNGVVSEVRPNARAQLHAIFGSPSAIRTRTIVADDYHFLTGGGARNDDMLLLSNYHDQAYTRNHPDDRPGRHYWRWSVGLQYSHVLPGRFSPRRRAGEYFLYRVSDGRYAILMRGRAVSTTGQAASEGDHTIIDSGSLLPEADIVVPGVFSAGARQNGTTDLLLYRSETGRQEYYTFAHGGSGGRTPARAMADTFKNWAPDWSLIVPMDWPGRDRTSLMLYNSDRKQLEIWHSFGDAQMEFVSRHATSGAWTFATQVGIGGSAQEQVYVLFYSRPEGRAQVWSFPNAKLHADVAVGDYEFLFPDYARILDGSVLSTRVFGYRVT